MNMFARFDENPAMTLQDIKETKRYGRTDTRTDGRTHGRTTWKQYTHHKQSLVCGGYNYTINILLMRAGSHKRTCLNSKQERPWSDCFFKSSLVSVWAVCLSLLFGRQLVFKILEQLPYISVVSNIQYFQFWWKIKPTSILFSPLNMTLSQ